MRTSIIVAALCVASSPARAQRPIDIDSLRGVATSGIGTVTVAPDRAVLRFSVDSRGQSAAAAAALNASRVNRLLDSLNSMRPAAESVQLVSVEVGVEQNYQTRVISGYSASALVRVVIRDLSRLGAVLDRAVANGATGVGGISFTSEREPQAKQDAIALAVAEARGRAEAVTRAAGVRLGSLVALAVQPDDYYSSAFAQSGVDIQAMRRAAAIAPQGVQVRMTVSARWELIP